MMRTIKTYSELIKLPTFEDRFDYLKLNGIVCDVTFGAKRYLNQVFYRSKEWKRIRRDIIIRDNGCDLGVEGFDIHSNIYIHHMVPITEDDIYEHTKYLTNPEYLICASHRTHNAIHYGDVNQVTSIPIARTPYDTCPWRK